MVTQEKATEILGFFFFDSFSDGIRWFLLDARAIALARIVLGREGSRGRGGFLSCQTVASPADFPRVACGVGC